MTHPSIQQWKCALGNVMKKMAYGLGGLALVAALVVARLTHARVASVLNEEVGNAMAFTASFLTYLMVVGAGALLAHYAIWRVGDNLAQTQELTWKRDEAQTRPRGHLTSSTPVP